ncbi:MAG TPA: hypothetical protein DCZ84_03120 [Candidatus Vogelbacteria bacterium]|uniref:Uncharacterized protein n=1 Tax=Candidatus Vogelbacteria bacterium RIFOXYD1_FULL_51_18 TaxID=1802440 RepID=A0A1G2QKP2_9BACT|nr:MAG: hypothetical protein UY66_C0012G0009 [Parcubacteria group bacterium GW2011_GWC1_51_35]KKW24296.1 MAG: hypothetical protein UY68_C0012G0037 [Parcubacteria group bacterium GW2011_GWF2_52_12]KKW26199.1 MAG: hypothetical protein UY69_C0032G0001 [Parcubacteria group bacterium GW2011_GWF1_52_5]KKW34637.1 MAG: hypothetical protein UY80_C0012G0001 [Parcubacteria group bacterium GW2011_GWB1_53_43]OHA60521.1 MAG: hypothetical protein A2569_01980 [Candidatus Vogelbacteria bacterium RIFOXYD1_FULL_5
MKTSLIVSLVVSVLVGIFLINQGYQLNRDVESVAHRAQVAADVPDMLEYMKELKSGMERHGMTRGHTALIFKTPANDLAKLNGSISSIITRLEAVKDIPRTETTYQVALDDIRGTIRELEGPSGGYLWVQYWFLFLAGIGIWIWPAVAVIFFCDDF